MVLRSEPMKKVMKSRVSCLNFRHMSLVDALLHQATVCILVISDTENIPAIDVHNGNGFGRTCHSLHAMSKHGLGYTV